MKYILGRDELGAHLKILQFLKEEISFRVTHV